MRFECQQIPEGDTITVRLHGEMTWDHFREIRDSLREIPESRVHEVDIDMSDVPYVDEEGMAALLGLIQRAMQKHIQIRIYGEQRQVAERLRRAGIYLLLPKVLTPA